MSSAPSSNINDEVTDTRIGVRIDYGHYTNAEELPSHRKDPEATDHLAYGYHSDTGEVLDDQADQADAKASSDVESGYHATADELQTGQASATNPEAIERVESSDTNAVDLISDQIPQASESALVEGNSDPVDHFDLPENRYHDTRHTQVGDSIVATESSTPADLYAMQHQDRRTENRRCYRTKTMLNWATEKEIARYHSGPVPVSDTDRIFSTLYDDDRCAALSKQISDLRIDIDIFLKDHKDHCRSLLDDNA